MPAKKHPTVETAGKPDDVVLVHGSADDGKTLSVIRKRGDAFSSGTIRAVEDGKPVHGEVVRLTPRTDAPMLCDVEVIHEGRSIEAQSTGERQGPSQVASVAYRTGWDGVWGDASGKSRAKDTRLN